MKKSKKCDFDWRFFHVFLRFFAFFTTNSTFFDPVSPAKIWNFGFEKWFLLIQWRVSDRLQCITPGFWTFFELKTVVLENSHSSSFFTKFGFWHIFDKLFWSCWRNFELIFCQILTSFWIFCQLLTSFWIFWQFWQFLTTL